MQAIYINLRVSCTLLAVAFVGPVFSQTSARPLVTSIVTASAFGGYVGVAAPGSYVEIYGSNLAGSSREWTDSDFIGAAAPTSLDGVTVSVNGTPAYVSYVSARQVNIQIPDSVPSGSMTVVLSYQGQSSTAALLTMNALQPGLLAPASFRVNGTQYVAALHGGTGAFVSGGNIPGVIAAPAVPGETLVFYGTGFGAIRQNQVAGQIASGQTALANPFTMTIGGLPATVTYAGLAPGLAGVYQFNAVVPLNLSAGDLALKFSLNGAESALQNLLLPVSGHSPSGGFFSITSADGVNGGQLLNDYTCDGTGSTLPLTWSNAPVGTKEFAVMMTTLPGDGTTKWNWVLYGIPANITSLAKNSFLVGTPGLGSDEPGSVYNPPCSQGPGAKIYTYTVYALSAAPVFSVPASEVTGQLLTSAISAIQLSSAAMNLSTTRTSSTGSSTDCSYILRSTRASKSGTASVSCDANYAYVGSIGITTAPMMNGITSTNLQVPIPQNFQGSNAWKIPLKPAIAATPTSVLDGPLGVAINGVPIFNPCTQGGCVTGGDTKALGQLDSCNGHAGRAEDYHYHAAPTCMMADQPANYWDTHPVGWALDGFAIFGYRDADGTTAIRDAICGGNTKEVLNAPVGYSYHVTDTSPYVTSCLIGTPSPDLVNQSRKYKPIRQPPVTPFVNSGMMLTTDAADGYQVLQFTSAVSFRTTETGMDSYQNAPGTYRIRYKQVTGNDLAALLSLRQNATATACWNFQFSNVSGASTQPSVAYCK